MTILLDKRSSDARRPQAHPATATTTTETAEADAGQDAEAEAVTGTLIVTDQGREIFRITGIPLKYFFVPTDVRIVGKKDQPRSLKEGLRRQRIGVERVLSNPAADTWVVQFDAEVWRRVKADVEFMAEDITANIGMPPEGCHFNTMPAAMNSFARRHPGVVEIVRSERSKRPSRKGGRSSVWRRHRDYG